LLREAEAIWLATQEARPQARSSLLPQINASAGYTSQEFSGTSTFTQQLNPFDPDSVETLTSSFIQDSDIFQWQIELRQTLFRWDQWITRQQADKIVGQAEANYMAAQQDLLQRVAGAYFNVLAARDVLASEQAAKEAIARQLEQAQKRFEVGLIAITDVQEAQAAYDQAIAADIQAERSLATTKEVLREITGEYPGDLDSPIPNMPLVGPNPQAANSWVDTALQQNYALLASRLGAEIAKDDIRINRAGHLPTVDLVLGYRDTDTDSTRANLPGLPGPADSASDGDSISIQLSVPIYGGGFTSSRVRQAVYQHRAAKERLDRIARETERETRDAYLGVNSEISRVKALRQALESQETALRATEAGFDVGTRTTVDVLDARRALFLAQTNYARSRYDYILNVLRLKLAAGTLSRDDLVEIDSWLQP
jgi:outer membrane protein